MTAKEIISALEALDGERIDGEEFTVDSFAHCYMPSPLPNGIGEWEEVAQHGGEDQGSNWYSVKHFKDHDVYIKTTGFYQSHHGTDFEEGFGEEVKPAQKTITVYE